MTKKYIFILIVIGFMVYTNSLFNKFLWDDEAGVPHSSNMSITTTIPQFFLGKKINENGDLEQNPAYYRPVIVTINYILDLCSFGKPFVFRFFQVTMHIINSILIFLVFYYFFRSQLLSFFLACLFLVHPGISEAVFFISANQEVAVLTLGLLTVLFNLKTKPGIKAKLLIALMIFVSLLLKETAVIFLGIVLCYRFLFNKKALGRFLIIAGLFIWVYLMMRLVIGVGYPVNQGLFPMMRIPLLSRMLALPAIVLFYLKTFVFPWRLIVGQQWLVVSTGFNDFILPLTVDVFIFLAIVVWAIKTKDRVFIFFMFWFFFGLLPYLQIIPLNMTVAERWLYLPIVGLLGMMGSVMVKLKVQSSKLKVFFMILIITLLSVKTFVRSFDWRNGLALFSHDYMPGLNSFDVANNLGAELFRAGQWRKAKRYFMQSIQIAPYWWINWNNLGAVYEKEGNLKAAEECYKNSIDRGDYALAYENYAGILIKQKKLKEAKEFLEKRALIKFSRDQYLINIYRYLLEKSAT